MHWLKSQLKRLIFRIAKYLVIRFGTEEMVERAIPEIAKAAGIDLLMSAYHNIGILKYENDYLSGEHYFLTKCLSQHIKSPNPIFFDVGANVGEYSKNLRRQFPGASIYAFEPNVNSYAIMHAEMAPLGVTCLDLGVSSESTSSVMYTYKNELASQHASIYRDVLTDLHEAGEVAEIEFKTTTIDEFCAANDIHFVDLLKIDTEGHEWEVLTGARKMLAEQRIKFIQFEFNEMNIIARVFLKDFYKLLEGYRIYRLDSDRLIPLFKYCSANEIFKFQNLLAVDDRVGPLLC
jgi:FkbM family methyltransferase